MKWGGLLLALVAGCSGETLRDGICYRDGALDCGGPCPSFEAEAAEVRDFRCSDPGYHAEIGACGEYRYTLYAMDFSSEAMYFDASGKLVALESGGDQGFTCDGGDAYIVHYGPFLDCQKAPTEVICSGI